MKKTLLFFIFAFLVWFAVLAYLEMSYIENPNWLLVVAVSFFASVINTGFYHASR